MANTGCAGEAEPLADASWKCSAGTSTSSAPPAVASRWCATTTTNWWAATRLPRGARGTYELCEFLVDVLKVGRVQGRFPNRVGLHQSCHGLRELRLGSGSERNVAAFNKVGLLLQSLEGLRARFPDAARRMLRLRRHVRRERRGRLVHDGAGPHRTITSGRRRSDHRQRHVVPDAPGRPDSPQQDAARVPARRRDPRGAMRRAQRGRSAHDSPDMPSRRRASPPTRSAPTGTTARSGSSGKSATGWRASSRSGSSCASAPPRIKAHTMLRLADYLEQFEREATAPRRQSALGPRRRRAQPHRARDPGRAAASAGWSRASRCSPRSATSIRTWSGTASRWSTPTWASGSCSWPGEPPSHIVLPAIHMKKEEVGELFHEHLGTEAGATDPNYLAEAARGHLREKFMAGRRRPDRRQLRHRRDRRHRRLHQRGQRRPGRVAAASCTSPAWASRS